MSKVFPMTDWPDDLEPDEDRGIVSDFEFMIRVIQSRKLDDMVEEFAGLDPERQEHCMSGFRPHTGEVERLRAENEKLRADLNHEEVFIEKVGEANKRLVQRRNRLKAELREWAEAAGKLQAQTNPGEEWCATCGGDLVLERCFGCHGCSDDDCLPIDCGDCLCGEGEG
jgi:hypothetical protein